MAARLVRGRPLKSRKASSGVVRPQGIERLDMVGPGETLVSPWPPFAIHPCSHHPNPFLNAKKRWLFDEKSLFAFFVYLFVCFSQVLIG
jgi:hypothetical protein